MTIVECALLVFIKYYASSAEKAFLQFPEILKYQISSIYWTAVITPTKSHKNTDDGIGISKLNK